MEQWKDVEGYEGLYEVSNTGFVRSKKGKTTYSALHGERVWESRILKNKTDKGGYKRVTLYKDRKAKDFLVHRLVALAFIPKVEGKELINHKDCNPSNNEYTNLEWCDHRENLIHAFVNKLNPNPSEIRVINKRTGEESTFYSMAEASKSIGRSHGYVSALLKRGKSETKEFKFEVVE